MRASVPFLLGVLALSACQMSAPAGHQARGDAWSSPGGYGHRSQAELQAEIRTMEARWMMWRGRVMQARSDAAASGRPLPPEVDAQMTELLNRDLGGPDNEERLRRLSDAVSDARRLAELASLG